MAFGNNIFAHGINRPYTAPELIHHTLIPTLSSDVYSFSIILLRLSLSSSNQPAHRHASILRKNYEEILRTQQYVMEEMNNDGKGVIVVALLPVWIKWLVDVGMTAFDPRKRPPFTFIARVIAVNKQNTFIHEAITVYKDVRVLGKMERAIRFLKREKKDVKRYGRMRMALFVMIPILVIGIVMAILTLTGKFNNGSSNNSTNTNNNSPGDFQINSPWIGVNSYYLYALPPSSQDTIIAFLASRGVKIIRIIIESPPTNNSGHHPLIPDFEPSHAGANYDYTILRAVDSLMRRSE